ncbi:unnamed protein product [Vitrella brassicaformis CCMP3155]|uniref:Uncharacterized protein n=1 Tax=Vitrella brassicaformis (strain CCMP3155) TaxID=1169540 RepID=A0A0G4H1U0_VITBC|nr:unnamed protein product [Vitrella brassicaformis CCMP3155]|eukprot:CEM37590.1 unnamed protein product [Vitrella brassicaformis CCMP3155]
MSAQQRGAQTKTVWGHIADAFAGVIGGIAALGKASRATLVYTNNCIQRTSYPIKEDCIRRYDKTVGAFRTENRRTSKPRSGVVNFAASRR